MKEICLFQHFYMFLKKILCAQHFCSFGGMLIVVLLLINKGTTDFCVPCMLEHVCYEPFSLKKSMENYKISYVNWLEFMHCLKFMSLRLDLGQNSKVHD